MIENLVPGVSTYTGKWTGLCQKCKSVLRCDAADFIPADRDCIDYYIACPQCKLAVSKFCFSPEKHSDLSVGMKGK